MEKKLDLKGRWRHRTVAFRVSEEEAKMIDVQVKLSGLTKQDYIVRRLLRKDIIVQGNPKVYKALRDTMLDILSELNRLETCSEDNDELLYTIQLVAEILNEMKEEG